MNPSADAKSAISGALDHRGDSLPSPLNIIRKHNLQFVQLFQEGELLQIITPDGITPPVGADPTEGEQPGEVQAGDAVAQKCGNYSVPSFSAPDDNMTLAGRFKADESAPVTQVITLEPSVYFYPRLRGCTEEELELIQERLELDYKKLRDDFPKIAHCYFLATLTPEKPAEFE